MDVCEICKTIPFHKLPSEEDPGWPHQSSFQALEDSAKKCKLCNLILDAACDLRNLVERERNGDERANPAEWREFVYNKSPSGGGTLSVTSLGSNLPGPSGKTETEGEKGRTLITDKPGNAIPSQGPVRPWLYGNWWALDTPGTPRQLIGLGVRLGFRSGIEDAEGNTKDNIRYRGSSLRIRTDNDSYMASFVPGRLRTADSASTKAFARVRSWVHSCDQQHRCVPSETQLPTRVLDIGGNSGTHSINLVETQGQRGRYLTLSHCWGTSHRITTTSSTLQARKKGILISELPKTFQDAILIARYLQVQYLWIDSLCIIQDSYSDWEYQSSRMADVYAKSYLTIAASSSSDDSSGCFPSMTTRFNTPHLSPEAESLGHNTVVNAAALVGKQKASLEVEYFAQRPFVYLDARLDHGAVSRVYISKEWMPASNQKNPRVYRIGTFGSSFDPISREPLVSRAWTLQERLLSSRTLHYGSEQLYWECQRGLLSEDGSRFQSIFFDVNTILEGQRLSNSQHGRPKGGWMSLIEGYTPEFPDHGRWRGGWVSLINNYSKRKLTREHDKLPALSGLARLIAEQTNDVYYAGLWKNHILEDLHWRVYAREEYISTNPALNTKPVYGPVFSDVRLPTTYRAPSWSWASLDASVLFKQMDFDRIVADSVHCYIEPFGSDLYGRVKAGWIRLRAPLVEIQQPGPDSEPPQYGIGVEINVAEGISKGAAFFDIEPHFPCFALFLDVQHSLVLKLTNNGDKEYVRIGIAKFLWTPSQKARAPTIHTGNTTFGPITDLDQRAVVTIV